VGKYRYVSKVIRLSEFVFGAEKLSPATVHWQAIV
jgi:hypothetical protein